MTAEYDAKANVPAYMIGDGKRHRISTDHLGSVRVVVNAQAGEVVQRMAYSPFGEVIVDTNRGGPAVRVRRWGV